MKINERYEIRVVAIETKNGTTGNVYDNFKEFEKENPLSSFEFGYVVFDTINGYVPDNCNDWNDTPEEALYDFVNNVMETHYYKEENGGKLNMRDLIELDHCVDDLPGILEEQDLKEIVSKNIKNIFDAYEDWCDLTYAYIRDNYDYLERFSVDEDKLYNDLKNKNDGMYYELNSGKVLVILN